MITGRNTCFKVCGETRKIVVFINKKQNKKTPISTI